MKRILFFVLALLAALPVSAQNSNLDAEQMDNLQVVMDAIERIETLDSFTLDTEQTLNEQIEFNISKEANTQMTLRTFTTSNFQVARTDNGHDAAGTINQQNIYAYDASKTNMELSYHLVMLANRIYVRVDVNEMDELLNDYIPEGWVEATKTGVIEKYPFLASFNQEYIQQYYSQYLPINETNIRDIQEIESQEIDGQPMRVFELLFETNALLDSPQMNALATSMTLPDPNALAEATVIVTVFIGQEDGTLYRLENRLTADTEYSSEDMFMPIKIELTSTKTFSHFNEPVTIEAPQFGM